MLLLNLREETGGSLPSATSTCLTDCCTQLHGADASRQTDLRRQVGIDTRPVVAGALDACARCFSMVPPGS